MTLTFSIHHPYFHIKDYHCFRKMQCFTFPHSKFQGNKFDLDEKWVKVNLVTILINLVELGHLMLPTKFQGVQPSGSGEEDLF